MSSTQPHIHTNNTSNLGGHTPRSESSENDKSVDDTDSCCSICEFCEGICIAVGCTIL
jgi:hypothetical protein